MRRETITYDQFCQTVQKMQAEGEKISNRTILSHLGGSFGTVAAYLKRWRQEQAYALAMTDRELSPNLRQAILAEIGGAITETKNQYQTQLTQANEQLDEILDVVAKQEAAFEEYESKVKKQDQQLATAHQAQTQHSERIQILEAKLDQYVRAQHEADKRAAIAETRCQELEKQLLKLEKEKETTQYLLEKKEKITS